MNALPNMLSEEVDEATDLVLMRRSLDGDSDALRELVERHQPFVFNVAMKLFGNRENAEDLTQEVMIKFVTHLHSFRGESGLRTWLYRIATNHFLKTRRRGMELAVVDFDSYFDEIDRVPDDQGDELSINDETVEELRLRCTAGMLMCLDREQRLIYILGALFGVSHQLGADILDITPGNFRVRLHRARGDLYKWMHQRCGLVNQANPCRCAKKTHRYVREGLVDPERLIFKADFSGRIADLTRREAATTMDTVERLHEQVFLDHPMHVSKTRVVDQILGNQGLRGFFNV